MNIVNHKLFATAISLASLAGYSHAALASGPNTATFKPLHAVTFDVGPKRAVGYFTSATDKCQLVLTLADAQSADAGIFQATRFEISIPEYQIGNYVADGQTLEFACGQHAETMTFKRHSTVASASDR